MNRKNIHRFDWFYSILKPWVNFGFRNYYRKVTVVNSYRIPHGGPVIFAPNHQNALMDALAVLYSLRGQPVFMARADIFRHPLQAKLLHFFKIMPVFRIRDGIENLGKNDETFDAALTVLKDNHSLCLMPEGNHGDKRKLRPLVKGIFRIAFMTQEELGERPVHIVPVGIDYEHYQKVGRNLLINFGEPINVLDYINDFRENKAKAINTLKERLAIEMRKVMIDIQSESSYDVFHEIRQFYTPLYLLRRKVSRKNVWSAFDADKKIISKLEMEENTNPEKISILSSEVRELSSLVQKLKLRYWIFNKDRYSLSELFLQVFYFIIGFPIFLYGLINNILPFQVPSELVRRKNIKDPQFHSSFAFVLALLSFTIFYILQITVVALLDMPWWAIWLYIPSLPLTGWFAFRYFILTKKWSAKWRYNRLQRKNNPDVIRAKQLFDIVVRKIDRILGE